MKFIRALFLFERSSGLEPEIIAWEAIVLPLHHDRNRGNYNGETAVCNIFALTLP